MELEPPNLRIPLQARSRLWLAVLVGVIIAIVLSCAVQPAWGKAMLATTLCVLPAIVFTIGIPIRRRPSLGMSSPWSVALLALLVAYLLIAKRWLLPALLAAL